MTDLLERNAAPQNVSTVLSNKQLTATLSVLAAALLGSPLLSESLREDVEKPAAPIEVKLPVTDSKPLDGRLDALESRLSTSYASSLQGLVEVLETEGKEARAFREKVDIRLESTEKKLGDLYSRTEKIKDWINESIERRSSVSSSTTMSTVVTPMSSTTVRIPFGQATTYSDGSTYIQCDNGQCYWR